MMTMRTSLDTKALKWGGVAIVAFLLGAFVTLPTAPQTAAERTQETRTAVSSTVSPAAAATTVARKS